MTTIARIYLRASTADQNASRAEEALLAFAAERGLRVVGRFIENESGAKLDRQELFRALRDSQPGDVLLVEQVDRLSRLGSSDWARLRALISERGIRIVALDLPTSWQLASPNPDEFTNRMFDALNGMMLEMLAAIARKDYEDRRRRAGQGIAKAKADGRYKGRPEDTKRLERIEKMLRAGMSWTEVMKTAIVSRGTVAKVAARLRAAS
jgi:DNA invertase Pin-like site-specific DNA recombinase